METTTSNVFVDDNDSLDNKRMLLQSTMILSLIIYLKVVYTNVNLGGTKLYAGTRAPEDTYQENHEQELQQQPPTSSGGASASASASGNNAGPETSAAGAATSSSAAEATATSNIEVTLATPTHAQLLEAQDRAQRIVNNDLENIPYTLALSWGAVVCILNTANTNSLKGLVIAHIILMTLFTVCRIGHTFSYLNKMSYARTIFYFLGLLSSLGIIINALVATSK